MKYILPCGRTLLIDKEDAGLLQQYKFHYSNGYIATEIGSRAKKTRKTFRIHRLILKAKPNQIVDHINQNPLDNRKVNLRFATKSTNGMNRKAQANSSTGAKGICWSTQRNKFRVYCSVDGKQYHLGFTDTLEEAKKIYIKKIHKYHKEYSCV